MTNEEWITQKLTAFVDWVNNIKRSRNIALACWVIVVSCLILLYKTQRLAIIAVIVPTAIVGAIFTANAIIRWLDAEHKEIKNNETKQL